MPPLTGAECGGLRGQQALSGEAEMSTVQDGSHGPQVAGEHWKCAGASEELKFEFYLNLNSLEFKWPLRPGEMRLS